MGQYCRVLVRDSNDQMELFAGHEFPNLNQSYDSFAVLIGTRNYNNIVPIFERNGKPDFLIGVDTEALVGYGWWTTGHFTLEQFDAFDFDQPLKFIVPGEPLSPNELHRAESLQEGDTYRSFMERETVVFEWIESIRQLNRPDVTIVMFFD